jgi:hypothetical protein
LSIQFVVSRDKDQLNEYYQLRERCFRSELDLPNFDGSEEEGDIQGKILLALWNGRCIGGARISGHVALPSHLEQLDLKREDCCMWERFVIEPSVRTVELVREFCAHLVQASHESGYQYAMVLSSLRNARFYRRCHSALGVGFEIHRPVPHSAKGAFAGLEHYLSISHLHEQEGMRLAV